MEWIYPWTTDQVGVAVRFGPKTFEIPRGKPDRMVEIAIRHLESLVKDGIQVMGYSKAIADDQIAVSSLAEVTRLLRGAESAAAGEWIFESAANACERARIGQEAKSLKLVVDELEFGWRALERARGRWRHFEQSDAAAAELNTRLMQGFSVACITISSLVLTGGAASALGTGAVGTGLIGGGVGGTMAIGTQTGRELGEWYAGINPGVQWRQALTAVGVATATGFVSAFCGKSLQKPLEKWLQAKVMEAVARELGGKVTAEALAVYGSRLLTALGQSVVAEAFRSTITSLRNGESLDEFFRRFAHELMVRGLARAIAQTILGGRQLAA